MIDPGAVSARLILQMRIPTKHSIVSLALVFAQLAVIVLGHGRVVVCHDENGSSHIELVGEDVCSNSDSQSCEQPVFQQDDGRTGTCSGSNCIDEIYSLESVLAGSVRSWVAAFAYRIHTDDLKSQLCAVALPVCTVDVSAYLLIPKAQRLSIQSTVMII